MVLHFRHSHNLSLLTSGYTLEVPRLPLFEFDWFSRVFHKTWETCLHTRLLAYYRACWRTGINIPMKTKWGEVTTKGASSFWKLRPTWWRMEVFWFPRLEAFWRSLWKLHYISSVQFSRSVVSDSAILWIAARQASPCPSPAPGVHSNSCPSSRGKVNYQLLAIDTTSQFPPVPGIQGVELKAPTLYFSLVPWQPVPLIDALQKLPH